LVLFFIGAGYDKSIVYSFKYYDYDMVMGSYKLPESTGNFSWANYLDLFLFY
tara:strand:- start:389 stop:544 length:156 start_codon:yes stop_codon:yes gene_type:complete